jgi:hypothetical protein
MCERAGAALRRGTCSYCSYSPKCLEGEFSEVQPLSELGHLALFGIVVQWYKYLKRSASL